MRPLYLMIFVICAIQLRAQDCKKHALLKEGTELEYATYMPKVGAFGRDKGYFQTTRLILAVKSVTDSAGATYAIISKKGVAYEDPRDSYEKTIVVKCDGKSIFLGVETYSPDTVFLVDVYPKIKRKGFYYASRDKVSPATYSIPLMLGEGATLSIDKNTYKQTFVIRDYMVDMGRPGGDGPSISSSPSKTEGELEVRTPNIKFGGKEKVKTKAGEFDCYKIELSIETYVGRTAMPGGTMIMYISPEIGLVKTENRQSKFRSGYTELVNVK